MQTPNINLGQLLDAKFYETVAKSVISCCTCRSRENIEESDAEASNFGSAMLRWMQVPDLPGKVDIGETAIKLLNHIRPANESVQAPATACIKVPIWEQEPTPLPGWTITEQRQLMVAAKEAKLKATQDPSRFRRRLEKISKQFPSTTAKDCEECFRHVESSRIVYFGAKKQ